MICGDCHEARADVVCCDTPLCLLHARCTVHAGHTARWRAVGDVAAAERALARVHASLVQELADELAAAQAALDSRAAREAAAARGVRASAAAAGGASHPSAATTAALAALRQASTLPAPPLTGQAYPKPALPTFDSVRRRALDAAASATAAARPLPPPRASLLADSVGAPTPAAPAPTATAALRAPSVDQVDAAFGGGARAVGAGSGRAAIVRAIAHALERGRAADVAAAASIAPGAVIDDRTVVATATDAALAALAEGVEGAVWEAGGSSATPAYRDQVRRLVAALAASDNSELRARVVGGELPPHAVARLDVGDLESAATRAFRAAVQEREARPQAAWTWTPCGGACPACKALHTCQYTQVATASDSRKAEIWGSSAATEVRAFRLRCTACAHEWTTDAVPPAVA